MIHLIKSLLLIFTFLLISSCLPNSKSHLPSAIFVIFIKGASIDEIHCQGSLTSLPSGGFQTLCQKKPLDIILIKSHDSFEDSLKTWTNPSNINIPSQLSIQNWVTSFMPATPPLAFSEHFENGFQIVQDNFPVKKNSWNINSYSQFESLIQFSKTLNSYDKSYTVITLEDLENELSQIKSSSTETEQSIYRESIWESIDQSLKKFLLYLELDFSIKNHTLIIFGTDNQSKSIRALIWNSDPYHLPDLKYENLDTLNNLSSSFHASLINKKKESKQNSNKITVNKNLTNKKFSSQEAHLINENNQIRKIKSSYSNIINNRSQDESIKKIFKEALRAFDINKKLENPLKLSNQDIELFENLKN